MKLPRGNTGMAPPPPGYTPEQWKALSKSRRWAIRNPERAKELQANWVANNAEHVSTRHRKYELKNKYGITEADYAALLEAQDGRCAICRTDKPTGKWKCFAVDHCHKTGRVRGLLCNECNRGIGLLKDSPELLLKAVEYLNTR